ncbi:2-C-methyl-D-erythritol 4-phosphate cytidylyltransferase [Ligilactobacillus sp. WC1T17]|uniref:Ribitol-5-phosphate cytidylyltransferase n=1 Tax=Ligilactobacillus ruminis TaxID=1623 RepID=A0ABY1A8T0_9LACO|nr:2-C-methyl-D-erythritol 4-phosphate cytidylyltransferase [Ligilactobacillus ruminis]
MNIAVIFAGGVGMRMRSKDRPKQFLNMHGKPIIVHTLELFENHPDIDAVVVACIEDWIPHLQKLLTRYNLKKVKEVVPGGKTGQASIYNGLCAAERVADGKEAIVLIHDGVRPLIREQTITDNINSVKAHGSAITSVPVKETVLTVGEDNKIVAIPDRSMSRLARAPQSFWLKDILGAHRQALAEKKGDFIDSCSMMQYYGHQLYLIEGPQENIKITTPDDFYTMRALLDAREDEQIYGLD